MKKNFIAVLIAVSCIFCVITALAAEKVTYTFSGVNCVTDGSTNEVTDAQLTEDITVTTSGDMNRKYAAITDLKSHSTIGTTYPIGGKFTASGSYMYLATATSNNNTIIILNMPEIKKGSKVTITFAKPTVTNNGSTYRNTGDPYAYLKIADRYISINGDNFDTWRTESVVTGEDTNSIIFHCDKWGAIAISKIEITDGNGEELHNLNVKSTQCANLKINGVKFCADENGNFTMPSLPEGEKVTISASKDGYKTAEQEIAIGKEDTSIEMPLECETDAVYYESDFGNTNGTLDLNGEFKFAGGIEAKPITRISANITFKEGGYLNINTDNGVVAQIKYTDGIYVGNDKITPKDNMEFTLTFDKSRNRYVCSTNVPLFVDGWEMDFNNIVSMSGENVTVEYVGISYPDDTKVEIVGPEKVSSLKDTYATFDYVLRLDYYTSMEDLKCSVVGVEGAEFNKNILTTRGTLIVPKNTSGKVTLCVEYNGVKTYKEVEIIPNPKITEWKHNGNTLNLNSSENFEVTDIKDEFGNKLEYALGNPIIKDYKSSDENVIKIDENGKMKAVGKGKATISANAYTGIDNIISVEYTVDQFYLGGATEADVSYISGDLIENKNITYYQVTYADGTKEQIKETQIPAATVTSDGAVMIVYYDAEGKIASVKNQKVKSGDKVVASNGNKKVYLYADGEISKITDTDTTMDGYEIKHKAGEKYEISPVYKHTNIGDVKESGKTLDGVFADGYYNITLKKGEAWRGDIFVNGFMVGNNVDQSDTDRKLTEGSLYVAEDIKVKNGEINLSMSDGSTLLDYAVIEKQPEFYDRPHRIYVLGDSLACNYYGDFEKEVGGGRTGWGQVLPNYVNVPVTNLANSGQYAAGLYRSAFPSVIENGEVGDIMLLECAYNDPNYSNREEMTECVKDMIAQCGEKGIVPILVTPNASAHDYKESVAWSSYLKDIAIDTGCNIIDLSKESYNFLYELYGDDADGNITKTYNLTEVGGDNLHSSYAGANVWASMVAQYFEGYYFYEDIVNKDYSYTFTDTAGNEITAKVE